LGDDAFEFLFDFVEGFVPGDALEGLCGAGAVAATAGCVTGPFGVTRRMG